MGLDLILAMMGGQQMQTTMLATPAGEQPVARGARGLLYAGFRLFARPFENLVADRSRRKPAVDHLGFRAAFRPQPVIDRQRADLPASLARPTVGQQSEREAVGAAGNGDGEKGRSFERAERRERGAELGEGQRVGSECAVQQPRRFFSVVARSLIAAPGCGKSRSSCASATQAFCFWLARASDMPSFKRSSGRLRPLRISLVAFGERARRFIVFAAHVIGLAEPILGAPGKRIVRVLSDKALEGLFCSGIICLLQQAVGVIVLLGGGAAG